MNYLLFVVYLIFFSWLVTKVPFFKKSGLSPFQIVAFFLFKILVAILYGLISDHYGGSTKAVDTWTFHYLGLRSYELLKTSPSLFFDDLFQNNYSVGYQNFFSSENSWWNDLHNNAFTMLLAFFNCLSRGNYYINSIFYSFITYFGAVGLYRLMKDACSCHTLLLIIGSFFIPSFVFWNSGIHKDGIIFLAIILIIYHFFFGLKKSFRTGRIIAIVSGFMLLLIFRNYLVVIFLPALLSWYLSKRLSYKPVFVFSFIYIFSICLFFSLRSFSNKLDFPQAVVGKQRSFAKIKGGSALPVKALKPTVTGFLSNAPSALSRTLLRPYLTDVKDAFTLACCIETMLFALLFVLMLMFHKKSDFDRSLLLFCIFFSFSILLTVGYTVQFLGAIVRYRSIILPFLIIPTLVFTNWQRITQLTVKKYYGSL